MSYAKRKHPQFPLRGASRADALQHGITEWQWRDERYATPFQGVKTGPDFADEVRGKQPVHPAQAWRETHLKLALAYTCVMKPGEFFAGITAAVLWNLPTPINPRVSHLIEVGVETGRPFPRRAGVQGRRFSPRLANTTRRNGLATLDASSIWATLGPRLDLPDRVALGDAIIHTPRIGGNRGPVPRPAHATLKRLAGSTEQLGRLGKAALREALPHLRTGSASAPETHLRLVLVVAGLPEPALDVDIYDASGQYLGTTECTYPDLKVAFEYEGDHHRTETKQWDRDVQKYSDYEDAGWKVVRVTANRLYRRRFEFVEHARGVLLDRGWRP